MDRIPFGRYKGQRIEDVPSDYLEWMLGIAKTESLKSAIEQELDYREEREAARDVPPKQKRNAFTDDNVKCMAREIVTRGLRSAAMSFHPDRGGDSEKMRLANIAAEALRHLLQ